METSLLHKLSPAYKERIQILALLLGVRAVSERWMVLLEAEAARAVNSREPVEDGGDPSNLPSQGLLIFLLGTVAFSERLRSLFEETRSLPSPEDMGGESLPPTGSLRGLLR